jgi:hypothetical protein
MTFLDRLESRLWDQQDAEARAEGFTVTRSGRWSRTYRHPAGVAAALARARATEAADAAVDTRTPARAR